MPEEEVKNETLSDAQTSEQGESSVVESKGPDSEPEQAPNRAPESTPVPAPDLESKVLADTPQTTEDETNTENSENTTENSPENGTDDEASTAHSVLNEPLTLKNTSSPENMTNTTTPEPQMVNLSSTPNFDLQKLKNLLTEARQAKKDKSIRKIQKILKLFENNTEISNDEVEKLLHVSDATATRYLAELEKQGKITKTSPRGRFVRYRRK